MSAMDIRIEYHQPDDAWAAVFIRDGEPWFLDGALVGMGDVPSEAVWDLIAESHFLVVHGHNFVLDNLSLVDRLWLFKLLDAHHHTPEENQERYQAMREYLGCDPYAYKPPTLSALPPLSVEEDLAVHMPPEIAIEQVVTPMTDEEADAIMAALDAEEPPLTDDEMNEADE